MYAAGGIPLLSIVLGFLLLIGGFGDTSANTASSLTLLIGGFAAWIATTIIVCLRWQKVYQAQIFRENQRMQELIGMTKFLLEKAELKDPATVTNYLRGITEPVTTIIQIPLDTSFRSEFEPFQESPSPP